MGPPVTAPANWFLLPSPETPGAISQLYILRTQWGCHCLHPSHIRGGNSLSPPTPVHTRAELNAPPGRPTSAAGVGRGPLSVRAPTAVRASRERGLHLPKAPPTLAMATPAAPWESLAPLPHLLTWGRMVCPPFQLPQEGPVLQKAAE